MCSGNVGLPIVGASGERKEIMAERLGRMGASKTRGKPYGRRGNAPARAFGATWVKPECIVKTSMILLPRR